ncbi:MAG: hypothetical protein HC836_46165 [Richelia sp. RM2_1_2]|nr:hypothetical protein [Richelia sp. RM2_1_2]
MIVSKKTYQREISDNEFQKVKWKKNKIQFTNQPWLSSNYDTTDMFNWIETTLAGRWHFKENWLSTPSGATRSIVTVHCFWFELAEDAILFKLRWWNE